jgi:hypothetical protein
MAVCPGSPTSSTAATKIFAELVNGALPDFRHLSPHWHGDRLLSSAILS